MKVLVVDDDIVARMMLMHLVDSCGSHAILEAEDGADAWRQLEAGLRPGIVFCDLRMPHLSGLELLQRVRADARMATLPFVLVSAASDAVTQGEAAALGASGYIVKPFRQDDVRAQFERLFPAAPAAEETPDEAPHEVARRLGIDHARLRLYLDGLARQLQVAMREPPANDEGAQARLNRLREGCKTLGLYAAATALARVAEARSPEPDQVLAALGVASAAVARQAERAACG
ncbi:response regulator [Telluria beijingensis]|uniref:response regulator n=1 Tax=Telluria beijingensis TaxID=3068633 RepID=UPI0027951F8E|nr:response regulator [Massilia sp. REN29]